MQQKKKCDVCGEEFIEYDLKAIPGRRGTRYICYRCLENGRTEIRYRKYSELMKHKRLGEK